MTVQPVVDAEVLADPQVKAHVKRLADVIARTACRVHGIDPDDVEIEYVNDHAEDVIGRLEVGVALTPFAVYGEWRAYNRDAVERRRAA